jgi:hypothetical protein
MLPLEQLIAQAQTSYFMNMWTSQAKMMREKITNRVSL